MLERGKSEKHRSEQMCYSVSNFLRNKKSIIPGKEVAFISALEAAQVRSIRGRQHFSVSSEGHLALKLR